VPEDIRSDQVGIIDEAPATPGNADVSLIALLYFMISASIIFFIWLQSFVSCKGNHGSLFRTALVRFTEDDS